MAQHFKSTEVFLPTHFTVYIIVIPGVGGLVNMLHHLVIFKEENIPTVIITFVTVELEWRFLHSHRLFFEQCQQGLAPQVLCTIHSFTICCSFLKIYRRNIFWKFNSIVPFLKGGIVIFAIFKTIPFDNTFNFRDIFINTLKQDYLSLLWVNLLI